MKGGLSEAIRKRLHRPGTECYLATEVLVRKAEDVKARRDEWDAGTKTNVKSFDDGALRLTDTGVSQIAVSGSDGFIADLNEALPSTSSPGRSTTRSAPIPC